MGQLDAGTFIGYQDGGSTEVFWVWVKDSTLEAWILKTTGGSNTVDFVPGGIGNKDTTLRVQYVGTASHIGTQTVGSFKTWVMNRTGLTAAQLTCRAHACGPF